MDLGTGGLQNWIQENVVTLVVLVLGVIILWAARGGSVGKGVTIAAGALVGLMFIGLASGNNPVELGEALVNLVFGN